MSDQAYAALLAAAAPESSPPAGVARWCRKCGTDVVVASGQRRCPDGHRLRPAHRRGLHHG